MKKIILILILILVLMPVALSIITKDKEYTAEKLFYRANRIHDKIKANPDVAPPAMIASVEKYLDKIIKRYPETVTARAAYMVLAETYIYNKKYDDAIEILDEFIASQPSGALILSRAYFLKGLAYEKQDSWDRALKEFTALRDEYAHTSLGLQMPLYVAQHYIRKGKKAEADRAYNNAVSFYKKLEEENKGNLLGYASLNFLTRSYMELKKYEEAGSAVEKAIMEYPTGMTLAQQLPYVELIFVQRLNRPAKAVEIYQYIINNTENNKLKEILQGKIDKIQEKKQTN